MHAMGAGAGTLALSSRNSLGAAGKPAGGRKGTATVRGAFLYPPTALLKKAGYYSWPGWGFDAEGHQKQYLSKITAMAGKLDMRIEMDEGPLFGEENVTKFINDVNKQGCGGLLLVAFKKSEWESVRRIVSETGIPTIAMATLGVLLNPHVNQLYRTPGVYVISSLDNFEAIEDGMRMIRTARWMKEARLLSVTGTETKQMTVENLGTEIHVVPMQHYIDVYRNTETTAEVRALARAYLADAKKCVEPSEADILEAARLHLALERLMADEEADAVMIQCLQGIRDNGIAPPCMSFMNLRDAGIVAGCQNDLNATLSMMLVQQLFGKPGFQQNSACETERNHYFGAHCTSPTKLSGPDGPAAPYILRNHAEAGIGCVPQVLWPAGREVTIAQYLAGKKAQMIVYSGKVVRCHDTPPAGGCRTNVELTINEVDDICDVKGMHQAVFLGNHARQLHRFCQLYDIAVVT
jgi:hypothetical protein